MAGQFANHADGRDGSQEKPYQVGDEIYFP